MGTWSIDGRYLFEECYTCKVSFAITRATYEVLAQTCQSFYCPHGHKQNYVRGKSEEEKLREERDRLAQRIAQRDDQIKSLRDQRDHEQRRVAAAKGQVTKLKNRAAAGVCPCCTRHFTNLERHMASKHPDFSAKPDDADNVVPLKRA